MALWYGSQEVLLEQILDVEDVISIVDAITVDELGEVAKEILTESGLSLALTGPFSEDGSIREDTLRQLLKL